MTRILFDGRRNKCGIKTLEKCKLKCVLLVSNLVGTNTAETMITKEISIIT